ncbi:3-isopropylmalate dehydratase small subunit [Roseiflexus castenholzii]|uniref:3-isopropylmalate dehydratase small subunit n=1 Tax=Roseiflexus castenholzii TaxID=120962 RepID=UPI003C7CD00B
MSVFRGIAHVYGDNIDTDRIIPGKYTKTLDAQTLAAHVLEDLDPNFAGRVRPGDVFVAGYHFGAGSSREQAAIALKVAGISVVIARSFAGIFYRNAINIGLPLVEAPDHAILDGHCVCVDLEQGLVVDETSGCVYRSARMPPVMVAILRAGGLVNYLRQYGDYEMECEAT